MATGLAIMGFGGGALIAAPLSNKLLDTFADQPADAIAPAFVTLGAIYFVVMMLGAFTVRRARRGLEAGGLDSPRRRPRERMITTAQRHRRQRDQDAAVLAAVGRPVLQRDRRHRHPRAGLADDPGPLRHGQRGGGRRLRRPALALQHERALRVVLDVRRDRAQARSTWCYLGIGAVLYFLLASTGTASVAWFVLLTGVILSFYGGGFATVPAYLKDLFGTIAGRRDPRPAADRLVGRRRRRAADRQRDRRPRRRRPASPAPTSTRCRCYIMVGVLVVGFIANLLIRPVDERFHEPADRHAALRAHGAATAAPGADGGEELGHGHFRQPARSCCGSWWRRRSPTA